MEFKGIHHVSALTASASNNFDFYTEIMGMRLVKKTVNQDDVSVYHLFYGDEKGNPGTELTFFEIPMAGRTREGNNSISATSLRVPSDQALTYWAERLDQHGVEREDVKERAGRLTLAFRDFEGQRIILVSDENNEGVAGGRPWAKGPVPPEYAIIGLGPVQLTVPNAQPTVQVLTELMGFRRKGQYASPAQGQPDIVVFETGEGGTGAEVHVEERTDLPRERLGRGGVHHVAFRVEDEEELKAWIQQIGAVGFPNSGYVDRYYFRSLYFREPNGILFEVATDGPGFDTDEHVDHLGETLALPPFLEGKREAIEANLKPLNTKR
ncbi:MULTISPECIES: ring-cleaving dioxygenase [Paenibacillus]|jgi:glyoxalase family protein|uniref:Glyoxalase/bleomycin resistance protein/dioxygenase n=2 Tax=Paenibacillus lactis TaxID=228574 RepID=G4HNN7_9BACL|nr:MULTISPECIES: ring-cleaving dioxygenase [Paenibacillus]EHB50202.1 Glyoxalase/bleomycin resistance protein/dioxygenase [Paenibacillus lactis 154]MBP1896341.1 glyoxalase family protein [Paenibacillus lactis]MCM3497424.1 ring-cleaving dioxygenase [Paenibacillus lactis]GIO94757.1 putative ring-cleaving dioxygenase MhqA [Paenibacillus lactis]HAG01004.1 ring-cleaving dioxygenase [Paenibacillus lactis]